MFNISALSSAYPTGEYLEGNFITVYVNNSDKIDRYFIKKYGDRSVVGECDDTDADIVENWEYDTQAIFFTHLTEWAKMFSALIKDYEPLWNVDGTEVTTYGETHKEDKYGATHSEDKYGATQRTDQYGAVHNEDKYGNAVTTVATPQYSDTHTTAKTTYPDATERNTDKVTDQYGQHTITTTEQLHTDEHDENTRTDTHSELLHTDEHDSRLHTNEFDEDEHDVTLRRTGNIGVTSSQKLVQDSIALYERQSFFSVILAIVVNEIGGIYYE